MNQYAHIKIIINDSGRKSFPFIVSTVSGRALGYFKNVRDAEAYCKTDAQAFV
jgi:hypothetical protein